MSNNYLEELFKKAKIEIDDEKLQQFQKFEEKLIEWNEKINLTTITDKNEIYKRHFIDSVIPQKQIPENANIIDVGTGAGFPGIPLKIIRDDINITLLDSVNKKINYLNDVITTLKLERIETVHSRAEDYAIQKREFFDCAISRAVANMSTLSEYLLPFVKVGGVAICMKGPNIKEELNEAKNAISILGGKVENIIEYSIPDTDLQYNLIIIRKEKHTPNNYPRKSGKPSSDPIK